MPDQVEAAMTRLVSLGTKIEQLDGLRDTKDLSEWEQGFVTSILESYLLAGRDTRILTSKQVDVIERIWTKHFA
jgi:hypothetical protein